MMAGPREAPSTYSGAGAAINGAINVPKPIQQPRVPVLVGGNGPNVTWRLAVRFADELNLDGMEPAQVAASLPIIHRRCEEIGREPESLRLSVNIFWARSAAAGQARVELLEAYRAVGVNRVQTLIREAAVSDQALESFAADARAAGATFHGSDEGS